MGTRCRDVVERGAESNGSSLGWAGKPRRDGGARYAKGKAAGRFLQGQPVGRDAAGLVMIRERGTGGQGAQEPYSHVSVSLWGAISE